MLIRTRHISYLLAQQQRRMSTITLPKNDKSHHVGKTFQNPWPSFKNHGLLDIFNTRFRRSDRNFVPIPTDRSELVNVQTADFARRANSASKLKATWIGHASWLIEFPATSSEFRGITILLDPVFAERTSPVTFLGPKRYSPLPCQLSDLPPVDAVLISHNHYDHLEIDTIMYLSKHSTRTVFICPLGNKAWFISAAGVSPDRVYECDWWEALSLQVPESGSISVVCTPGQHTSARTPFDRDATLWSGWAFGVGKSLTADKEAPANRSVTVETISGPEIPFASPRVYFPGDTGYRAVSSPTPTAEEEASAPRCPAFKEIGASLGPFDLALLPIGLYSPRDMLSSVHCSPEDSVCVHQDVKSKKTLGCHWGTFRGGISAQYEDVREPPRRFEKAAKSAGLSWGEEIGVCDIGETVLI